MRGRKAFGERIATRAPDRQTLEIHTSIALMTRFDAHDIAEMTTSLRRSAWQEVGGKGDVPSLARGLQRCLLKRRKHLRSPRDRRRP